MGTHYDTHRTSPCLRHELRSLADLALECLDRLQPLVRWPEGGGPAQLDSVAGHFQRLAWQWNSRFQSLGAFALGADIPTHRARFQNLGSLVAPAVLLGETVELPEATVLQAMFDEARRALRTQVSILEGWAGEGVSQTVLVPDTSAIMDLASKGTRDSHGSIAWEKLSSSTGERLVAVVLPVIKQLDDLKLNKDDDRKNRARGALGALWEIASGYAGRPRQVTAGISVLLVQGDTRAEEFSFLPTLDHEVSDHRILAATIGVARMYPNGRTALVTNDLSMALQARGVGVLAIRAGAKFSDDD